MGWTAVAADACVKFDVGVSPSVITDDVFAEATVMGSEVSVRLICDRRAEGSEN